MTSLRRHFSAPNDERKMRMSFPIWCKLAKFPLRVFDQATGKSHVNFFGVAMMISFSSIFFRVLFFFQQNQIVLQFLRGTSQECSDFWLMLHEAELRIKKLEKEALRQRHRVRGGCQAVFPEIMGVPNSWMVYFHGKSQFYSQVMDGL